MKNETTKKKKKGQKNVKQGKVFIKSTYNNTVVSITDLGGNVICQSSSGRVGFDGTRKATPYAAQKVMADVLEKAKEVGLQEVSVYVTGIGSARESAIRSLNTGGLVIKSIRDITPIPHNGVRARKKRRV